MGMWDQRNAERASHVFKIHACKLTSFLQDTQNNLTSSEKMQNPNWEVQLQHSRL